MTLCHGCCGNVSWIPVLSQALCVPAPLRPPQPVRPASTSADTGTMGSAISVICSLISCDGPRVAKRPARYQNFPRRYWTARHTAPWAFHHKQADLEKGRRQLEPWQ